MIKRVLIANRGEIAVRIIRSCKEMGIETVAIYSTADQGAIHAQIADYRVCIGPANSRLSYLNQEAIIQAACNYDCDAIHPGFGFLSENHHFAHLVKQCGLIFVGPDPEIIELMGDKTAALKTMKKAGVPVVPGIQHPLKNLSEAEAIASTIGYPVIIKAVSGGGGKGMRLVQSASELATMFDQAKQEAKINFGSDDVYLEKYIENPRHIEVQIIGDNHGHVIHLYERDCSFQRRHQKLIEEAPAYHLDQKIRDAIIGDAVTAAHAVGYNSVGTIEFLLASDNQHYFMEMNTRIQVEHPVTEMITGIDIVKEQLRVAAGRTLSIKQEDVLINGHAIECRINAEDVKNDFKAVAGKVIFLNLPSGKDVRIESAIYSGAEITPFYDSMIVKVITFAASRLECIRKMRVALEELIIEGVATNIEFHYLTLHDKRFIEGKYHTGYCEILVKELAENGAFI